MICNHLSDWSVSRLTSSPVDDNHLEGRVSLCLHIVVLPGGELPKPRQCSVRSKCCTVVCSAVDTVFQVYNKAC